VAVPRLATAINPFLGSQRSLTLPVTACIGAPSSRYRYDLWDRYCPSLPDQCAHQPRRADVRRAGDIKRHRGSAGEPFLTRRCGGCSRPRSSVSQKGQASSPASIPTAMIVIVPAVFYGLVDTGTSADRVRATLRWRGLGPVVPSTTVSSVKTLTAWLKPSASTPARPLTAKCQRDDPKSGFPDSLVTLPSSAESVANQIPRSVGRTSSTRAWRLELLPVTESDRCELAIWSARN
jgi:hypothetical protein